MYCSNCGAKLDDDANFCMKCGAKVQKITSDEVTDEENAAEKVPAAKKKNIRQKLNDKAVDTLGTKISGGKTETIRISMEDMLDLVKLHFIDPATTPEDYKAIQKTVNGGKIGVTQLESKDGGYLMRVLVVMQLGGRVNVLNPSDSNWIRITEASTGNVYQYSSFTWGKFKKAVKQAIEQAQK